MVYSTCTITRLENQDVLEAFLKEHPEFSLAEVAYPNTEMKSQEDGTMTIFPHQFKTEWFFISKLTKK